MFITSSSHFVIQRQSIRRELFIIRFCWFHRAWVGNFLFLVFSAFVIDHKPKRLEFTVRWLKYSNELSSNSKWNYSRNVSFIHFPRKSLHVYSGSARGIEITILILSNCTNLSCQKSPVRERNSISNDSVALNYERNKRSNLLADHKSLYSKLTPKHFDSLSLCITIAQTVKFMFNNVREICYFFSSRSTWHRIHFRFTCGEKFQLEANLVYNCSQTWSPLNFCMRSGRTAVESQRRESNN